MAQPGIPRGATLRALAMPGGALPVPTVEAGRLEALGIHALQAADVDVDGLGAGSRAADTSWG